MSGRERNAPMRLVRNGLFQLISSEDRETTLRNGEGPESAEHVALEFQQTAEGGFTAA